MRSECGEGETLPDTRLSPTSRHVDWFFPLFFSVRMFCLGFAAARWSSEEFGMLRRVYLREAVLLEISKFGFLNGLFLNRITKLPRRVWSADWNIEIFYIRGLFRAKGQLKFEVPLLALLLTKDCPECCSYPRKDRQNWKEQYWLRLEKVILPETVIVFHPLMINQ